ncbi:phosphatidylglycerophosphate synthase, putative [Trypanosoma cruzi marinkellei]|uniref:CDP-diacylglycerol--glycerol-3-phosphate 3-phosphatidyltransferase n=1 Tax=Trypanosoma cruzi marinkellei TaxID=85056 RepID=K2NHI8_TRYCR|nr:phosphatidylglycerophosphate synthase, putative [Trypanosoma cruzi marinkellei]
MVFLVAYLLVLAVAAFVTFRVFGSNRSGLASGGRGCGVDFFFSEGRQRRRPLEELLPFVDAQQAEMLSFLQETCCALPVRAESVHILPSPKHFFEELQKRVHAAKRRIVISALYIGDGPLARQFVACLEEKVVEMARLGQPLDICLLLDYNRMHDRHNLLTLKQLLTLAHSTRGSTTGIDKQAMVRVRLFLFQTPCRWNRLFAPFGRAKEALGVQHTKIFCFDDCDTILSGANLSDDYFSTRMDRYVVIEDNVRVAAWFSDLADTLCHMSHCVVCHGEALIGHNATNSNNNNNGMNDNNNNNNNNSNNNGDTNSNGRKTRNRSDGYTVHKKSELVILPNALGIDPSLDSAAFSTRAKQLLEEFAARAVAASELSSPEEEEEKYDTFLFPTLQFARANVFHDSLVVQQLLHKAPASTRIFFTSPYLNMYAPFVDEMLASETTYDFITASVNTNGWRGAKGLAGYIPYFYLQLERAFYFLMREYGCSDRVRVREFSVDGLTFHAKGVWFVESEDGTSEQTEMPTKGGRSRVHAAASDACANARETEEKGIKAPYLVAYGSTNYGYRSVHKDVEAEVFLFTANKTLRKALRDELLFILHQSTLVTEERFVHGAQGRFQPVVSLLAQMGQDFL